MATKKDKNKKKSIRGGYTLKGPIFGTIPTRVVDSNRILTKNNLSIVHPRAEELPPRTTTISVEMDVWRALKAIKSENQTFNDALKDLLGKSTASAGNKNVKAIKYARNILFFTYHVVGIEVGYECEYNDSKGNKTDFSLDLKFKKVFFKKRVYTPSEFFGVDNAHKYFSSVFLLAYLKAVTLALQREFKIKFNPADIDYEYEDIVRWRKFYYDYDLSNDSFRDDIEEPLRMSEQQKEIDGPWEETISESVVSQMRREWDG